MVWVAALERMADQERALGHRSRALHIVEELRARVERWVEAAPGDDTWLFVLAKSLRREWTLKTPQLQLPVGSRARDRFDPAEIGRAIAILQGLCARDPSRGDTQLELVHALCELARLLGDADEALQKARQLVARDPDRADWLAGLATALEVSGETLTSFWIAWRAHAIEQRRDPPVQAPRQGTRRDKPVVELKPGVVARRAAQPGSSTQAAVEDPARAQRERARQLRLTIRDGVSVQRYEEAIRIRRGLLARHPDDEDADSGLAGALLGLGRVHVDRSNLALSEYTRRAYELDEPGLSRSDLERAHHLFDEAVGIRRRLAERLPRSVERREALAKALRDLARVADGLDLRPEALAAYRSALVEVQWLAARTQHWGSLAVDCRRAVDRLEAERPDQDRKP